MTENPRGLWIADVDDHVRYRTLAELELLSDQAGDVHEAMSRITGAVEELMPASGGSSIVLYDAARVTFLDSFSTVPDQPMDEAARKVRRRKGATAWIAEQQLPYAVERLADDRFGANQMLYDAGNRAYIGVPVLHEGATVAVLFAMDKRERYWTDSDRDFLTAVGRRAAPVISRAQQVARLESALGRSRALYEVQTRFHGVSLSESLRDGLGAVAEPFRADFIAFCPLDTESFIQEPITVALDGHERDTTAYGLRDGEPHIELAPHPNDGLEITVTVVVGNREAPIGYLFIARELEIGQVTDDEMDFLESIAAHTRDLFLRHALLDDLHRSNQDLEQFAHVAAHDLRGPLQTVQGFLELLQLRESESMTDRGNQWVAHALRSAHRMNRIIGALLAFAQFQGEDLLIVPTALSEVTQSVLDSLASAIDEAGAVVTVDELPVVSLHEESFGVVLQNLVSNAIKFQPEGSTPEITIAAALDGDAWAISITDNGIGIAPDDIDEVFRMFSRANAPKGSKGTGIGLATCRRIVDRHGGTVAVEAAPGGGSRFIVRLPVER